MMSKRDMVKGAQVTDQWYHSGKVGEIISVNGPELMVKFENRVFRYAEGEAQKMLSVKRG